MVWGYRSLKAWCRRRTGGRDTARNFLVAQRRSWGAFESVATGRASGTPGLPQNRNRASGMNPLGQGEVCVVNFLAIVGFQLPVHRCRMPTSFVKPLGRPPDYMGERVLVWTSRDEICKSSELSAMGSGQSDARKMVMTEGREETRSPLRIDPILPVLRFQCLRMPGHGECRDKPLRPLVSSTFCAVPTSKPPPSSMGKPPEVRSRLWRAHIAPLGPPRTPANPSNVRYIPYSMEMRPRPIKLPDYTQDNDQLA